MRGMKAPLGLIAAVVLAFSLSSCLATSSDLYDIASRFEAREQGLITDAQLVDALNAKGDEIEERALAAATMLPRTPMGWMQLLSGMAATALAAGAGVNRHRNIKRHRRGEPV